MTNLKIHNMLIVILIMIMIIIVISIIIYYRQLIDKICNNEPEFFIYNGLTVTLKGVFSLHTIQEINFLTFRVFRFLLSSHSMIVIVLRSF